MCFIDCSHADTDGEHYCVHVWAKRFLMSYKCTDCIAGEIVVTGKGGTCSKQPAVKDCILCVVFSVKHLSIRFQRKCCPEVVACTDIVLNILSTFGDSLC